MIIRRARLGDVDAVVEMRYELTHWLLSRGTDQWTSNLGISRDEVTRRVAASIEQGGTWVTCDGDHLVGSIAIDQVTDHGLWTPDELAESLILHRMMVRRSHAGQHLGRRMITWAEQIALVQGLPWLRLDAWDTNQDLHKYYLRQGFERVRHVPNHRYPSATLFQRAVPNSAALPSF